MPPSVYRWTVLLSSFVHRSSLRRQRVPRRLVRIVEIERDGDTRRRCWSMLARGGVRPLRSIRPRGCTRRRRDTRSIGRRKKRERGGGRKERGGTGETEDGTKVNTWCTVEIYEVTKRRRWERVRRRMLEALVKRMRIDHFSFCPHPFLYLSFSLYVTFSLPFSFSLSSRCLPFFLFPSFYSCFLFSSVRLPLTAIRELPRVFSYSSQSNQRWHASPRRWRRRRRRQRCAMSYFPYIVSRKCGVRIPLKG